MSPPRRPRVNDPASDWSDYVDWMIENDPVFAALVIGEAVEVGTKAKNVAAVQWYEEDESAAAADDEDVPPGGVTKSATDVRLRVTGLPTLAYGTNRRNHVRILHALLRANDVEMSGVPGVAFGPVTEQAVMSFQRARGLSVDGVVDWTTWAELVRPEVIGEARTVQLLLMANDVRIPGVNPMYPHGDFDEQTQRAVRRWQEGHGLEVNGQVGGGTLVSLLRSEKVES